jgi:hypothetical protein
VVLWEGQARAKDRRPYQNTYSWHLTFRGDSIIKVTALLDTYTLTNPMNQSLQPNHSFLTQITMNHYTGIWVTRDGYIRHELLPNGRYNEGRGTKKSAYQGRYTITGNHIDYVDDTGFTADGEFRAGVLYHAGMVLYKEEPGFPLL